MNEIVIMKKPCNDCPCKPGNGRVFTIKELINPYDDWSKDKEVRDCHLIDFFNESARPCIGAKLRLEKERRLNKNRPSCGLSNSYMNTTTA